MVLKIEVCFLITSTIASCLAEVSHLVKDIKNDSFILCAAEDLHHSPRKLLEASTLKMLQNPLSGEIHYLWYLFAETLALHLGRSQIAECHTLSTVASQLP